MRRLCLTLVFVVLAGCASTGTRRVLQVTFVGTQAADLHSTHVALQHGAIEANPLLADSWKAQLAMKVPAVIFVVGASEHLASHGHKTVATALLASLSIAYGVIAARNYRLGTTR